MTRLGRRSWCATFLPALLFAVACGEPPNKEIGEAQGAIAAARAAGADRYGGTAFTDATAALSAATDAVAQRDYRLALNHALESREHAETAARTAAETRARLRGESERTLARVSTLLSQAMSRAAAAPTRGPRRAAVQDASKALASLEGELQKAGTAIKAEDYQVAQGVLVGLERQVTDAVTALEAAASSQSPRRRR